MYSDSILICFILSILQLKNDFEEIWSEKIYSVEQAVQALQLWCAEAEKSGVDAMEEFARKLRMLTLSESRVSF